MTVKNTWWWPNGEDDTWDHLGDAREQWAKAETWMLDAHEALERVLLFHNERPWGMDASAKILCDHIRKVLGEVET